MKHNGPPRWRRHKRFRKLHRVFLGMMVGSVVLVFGGALALLQFGGDPLVGAVILTLSAGFVWITGAFVMLRLLRPVRHLARVAGALQDGDLRRRRDLPASEDEVGQVADALQSIAGRVEQQLDDQRALMAAVSHELRSPLARLRVLIELGRDGIGPRDLHDQLQSEIDGMDALIADLLATSRIDFSALQPTELRVSEVIERAVEISRAEVTDLSVDVDSVRGDATLVTRALQVVLENARRHAGTAVSIVVRADENQVQFIVTDTGPGFPPGVEEQVFEPFWRPPGQASDGVGLGLSLVRRIAQAHGGGAAAENAAVGAQVRFWLPLSR